jgi:hypothetical protein
VVFNLNKNEETCTLRELTAICRFGPPDRFCSRDLATLAEFVSLSYLSQKKTASTNTAGIKMHTILGASLHNVIDILTLANDDSQSTSPPSARNPQMTSLGRETMKYRDI